MSCWCSRSCSGIPERRPRISCCRSTTTVRRSSRTGHATSAKRTSRDCTLTVSGRRCRRIDDVARTRVVRRGEGPTLVITLHEPEVTLLRELARDVREVVVAPADSGPVSKRLFPSAYLDPTEETAEAAWQDHSHGELVSSRLAALDALTATLDVVQRMKRDLFELTLDADGQAQWLGVLNDARLIIGTAAGISEDDDH